ncbi:alpha/beta hydrolase [Rosistilla ulvae]|uniref:alpha/beta hydrolase n=1 Tax=Rosistilla ulvae TaxID=1930277 RepID=UPI001C54D8D3|nr:alpha/beta hydrolase [Rosistilla ulvae]
MRFVNIPRPSIPVGGRASIRSRAIVFLTVALILSIYNSTRGHAAMLHEGDEYWVVNTRCISSNSRCANLESPTLKIYRYQQGSGLQHDRLDGLLARVDEDRSYLNVIYVHGNRFTSQEAIDRSLNIYRKVKRRCHDETKIRWILWSWPSDPIFNPLTDVRTKATRADTQALYAGWLLQHFPATDRLEMVGYSFGGRIVTGALHTAAGGSIHGRSLSGPPLRGARIAINLVAPALDRHWLARGSQHGLATENIGSMNLFYNSNDRVLKLYSMVSKYYNPVALGFAGLGPLAPRSDQLPIQIRSKDCRNSVGLLHDELKYYEPCCNAVEMIATSIQASYSPIVPVALAQ